MSANNCKCKKTECQEYYDCSGNAFCICKEIEEDIDLPVLIAPLPYNVTAGHSNRHYLPNPYKPKLPNSKN